MTRKEEIQKAWDKYRASLHGSHCVPSEEFVEGFKAGSGRNLMNKQEDDKNVGCLDNIGTITQEISIYDKYRILKEPGHKNIDWEQRRYELAKSAMQGLLNATSIERFTLRIKPSSIAEASLEYADELIKKLKKNNKKK